MTSELSALPRARRPWLRWIAFALAGLAAGFVLLIALFYAEENWRGKRAWENYKRERIAAGDVFDKSRLGLQQVPDDQNFYKTPLLVAHGYRNTNKAYSSPSGWLVASAIGDYVEGKRTKISTYYESLRKDPHYTAPPTQLEPAADIVRLFNQYPEMDELRQASLRTYSRCEPLDNPLTGEPFPNFVYIRTFAQELALLSKAELEAGKNENAFRDAGVIMKFADALQGNPTLVLAMIRVALTGLYVQTFWEGWADQRWTDKQYEAFQTNFLSLNMLADCERGFQGERVSVKMLMEEKDSLLRLAPTIGNGIPIFVMKAVPRGWCYQNLIVYYRNMEDAMAGVDVLQKRYNPRLGQAGLHRIEEITRTPSPFTMLAYIAIPNFTKANSACARTQAYINEAAIVCALERFRNAEGHYPGALTELSPKFMATVPVDVIGGQPFIYRLTGNRFQLYSVGLNEIDNGGAPTKSAQPEVGDWVWMYPVDSK